MYMYIFMYISTYICRAVSQAAFIRSCTAPHCNALLSATHCNTLQHTATHSSTHCITGPRTSLENNRKTTSLLPLQLPPQQHTVGQNCIGCATATSCATATYCNTLLRAATHCTTLQHAATRCYTPE